MAGLNGQQLREQLKQEKPEEYVRFVRSDLPGLAEELEAVYNEMAMVGKEPSEKYRTLVNWIRQEAAILNDPAYSGDFQCAHCGYGNASFKCPKCGFGQG